VLWLYNSTIIMNHDVIFQAMNIIKWTILCLKYNIIVLKLQQWRIKPIEKLSNILFLLGLGFWCKGIFCSGVLKPCSVNIKFVLDDTDYFKVIFFCIFDDFSVFS